jgi:DNA-binding LytR/AlgR family response regulator
MIRIALCDDNEDKGRWIDAFVEAQMKNRGVAYEKQLFCGSKNLLYEIQDGTWYDAFLLDIDMPELDGFQLTEEIRKYLPDAMVIFITDYEKYVYESFRVQPFRFIPKAHLEEMLPNALSDMLAVLEKQDGKFYHVGNRDGMDSFPVKSILYIWHMGKYTYLERSDGKTAKVRKTLKQVYEELPAEDFVWIAKGCICNLMQIRKISEGSVVLTNGTTLPISRDKLTEVKNELRQYWT